MHTIDPQFFNRPTVDVARDLLGKRLVRMLDGKRLSGIIVETEAYQADDPACHAYDRQPTQRTQALFGPVGYSYVYFTYGNHYCLNIVARAAGMVSGGVLIRALIPDDGIHVMQQNRNMTGTKNLTSGPGKLTQALQITRAQEHVNITQKGPLYIEAGIQVDPASIVATPRIGISRATDKLWRFVMTPS